jgi:hypothetical protein
MVKLVLMAKVQAFESPAIFEVVVMEAVATMIAFKARVSPVSLLSMILSLLFLVYILKLAVSLLVIGLIIFLTVSDRRPGLKFVVNQLDVVNVLPDIVQVAPELFNELPIKVQLQVPCGRF